MSSLRLGMGVLALALVAAACDRHPVEAPPPVRPVLSMVIQERTGRTADFVGAIEPRYRSDLSFRVLGRVVARSVDIGDRVTKDEVLAELDPMTFEMSLRSAEADLASAQAQSDNARGADQRMQALLEKGNIAIAKVDAARQARESAHAAVTQAEAGVAKAREQLGYTKLRSDFDGVVTAAAAQVGQVVSAGQTIATIARPDEREAVIAVPEGLARGMKKGTGFTVHLLLDAAQTATGPVREIEPQADPVTRTRAVRITLNDPPESFRLGANVAATLQTDEPPFIEIPAAAVLETEGKTKVWVVEGTGTATVALRDVVTGSRDGANVRIVSGLAAGQRVVTAGVHSLTPGQTVKVIEEARR